MSKRITHRLLKYEFSKDELADVADNMAKAAGELDAAEYKKKSVTAQCKAEIEKATAEHQKYYRLYRDKFEYRDIECELVMDHIKGRVTVARLDTGEIVEEREMTAEERQQELKLHPKGPEIDREPEVAEVDTDTDTNTDTDTDTETETETDAKEVCPDCGCASSRPYSDELNCCEECGQFMEGEFESDEPTPEDIARGVEAHGARLER